MSKSEYKPQRLKFTNGKVKSFKCHPDRNETLFWDTDEKTLCVRARPSGKNTYYYQSRYDGKVLKIRIGDLSDIKLTLDDARNKARDFEALVVSGVDPRSETKRNLEIEKAQRVEVARQSATFEQALGDYIQANKDDWSDAHLIDYQKTTLPTKRGRDGILFDFKDAQLNEITPKSVLTWLKKEKRYRPTAAAKGYRLLRACLNWADGQDQYSGVVDVVRLFSNSEIKKALPKPKARKDALLKAQVKPWFDAVRAINNSVIAASLQTMLLTGARRNEVLSLQWSDVDFQWESLRIKDKVEGERVIPLTPYIAQLLSNLPRRNKWVFSSETSALGRLTEPYIAHANAMVKAELPPLSLHGLRRSFGTLSEWVECPVGVVAQIQGHKPSATAEKHYRVRPLDLLQMWHNKIESQILEFGGLGQPSDLDEGCVLRVV